MDGDIHDQLGTEKGQLVGIYKLVATVEKSATVMTEIEEMIYTDRDSATWHYYYKSYVLLTLL
jgi:hypothetical protein